MLSSCEASEVFALLEGGAGGAREATEALSALFAAVREPWLTRALLHYHARTGSARALELLARAPDPHAKHLLDALQEQLRADRAARNHALAALAPLLARRPAWLHRLPAHPLARDLLRAARQERAPLPLLHALLALAALLPAAPALAAPHCADITDALLRPAILELGPATPTRDHLHLAQLALFRAFYATHPCTLLDALRADHAAACDATRDAWERAVAPLLESVRLHPALVTGSRQREADPAHWARFEPHDVVAECRRLSLPARGSPVSAPVAPAHAVERAPSPRIAPLAPSPLDPPPPGSSAHAARATAALRPGTEPWFPLGDRCGADSAPQTPLPTDADTAEPPEAAVEATPENTPAKETRAQFRFPADSSASRVLGGRRSQPPSPLRKETSPSGAGSMGSGADAYSGRLTRVARDRAALEAEGGRRRAPESPVPFGGAPPPAGAAVARPEPSRPPIALDADDREVLELTSLGERDEAWPEGEPEFGGEARAMVARVSAARARSPPCTRPVAPSALPAVPRRAASCPPRASGRARAAAAQTVDACPLPYEFLAADFYNTLPEHARASLDGGSVTPTERLDAYLASLYAGAGGGGGCAAEGGEQLLLVHAQLMYERWRREAHAERNRRLLGRCRQVRALELQNAALRERVRDAARERDELCVRLERSASARDEGGAGGAHEAVAALEAALERERGARARAEAALREAEGARARDAAELQRARGESFEAARHVEALARAALAAERRAEHVRRLRRELLVLAEREARLEAATRAALVHRPPPAPPAPDAATEHKDGMWAALCERATAAQREASAAIAREQAAVARAQELEAQVAARGALVVELERAARRDHDEGAAKLRALQDKYYACARLVRATEEYRLRTLAAHELAAPPRAPLRPASARALAPPSLAACTRTRALLDCDDE